MSNIGDLGRLLEGLPRPLVDFLKVSAITRGAATRLGSSIHDRLRINATYALKVTITNCSHLQESLALRILAALSAHEVSVPCNAALLLVPQAGSCWCHFWVLTAQTLPAPFQ